MSEIKNIFTSNAPAPAGHYSQGIVHNDLVYVSGQLPITKDGRKLVEGTVGEQAELAIKNVQQILIEAGSDLNRVLQMTIYITDVEQWGAVNEVYARLFGDHRPARAIVPVKELHYGLVIEIQAIAALK